MRKENRLFYIFLVLSAVVIIIGAILLLPKYEQDNNKETAKNEPTASPTPIPQEGVKPDTSWQKLPEKERSSWLKDRLLELNHPGLKMMAEAKLKSLDEKAIPELLKLSNDPQCGPIALNYLQKLGQKPEIKPLLQTAMTSEDRQAKVAVFKAGATKPTEEFKIQFIRALETSKDDDFTDQLLLIAQMETMKDQRIADALLKMYPTYADKSNYILQALAGQGDPRAVEPLKLKLDAYRKDMNNEDALAMRSNIVHTLGRIGGNEAMQVLLTFPPDENEMIIMDSLASFAMLIKKNPEQAKNLNPQVRENLVKVFESDKKMVYGAANDALCAITGEKIKISSMPSEQELKDLAKKWREVMNK